MKLFVPSLGTRMKVAQDWNIDLTYERRNGNFLERLGIKRAIAQGYHSGSLGIAINDVGRALQCVPGRTSATLTLPEDTVLVMDRIYIRKKLEEFDSITFEIDTCPIPAMESTGKKGFVNGRARFWVPLEQANTLEYELA